ncbi:HupE/UreJ family protein [Chamaesiphon sp. GL140_3_metabinner_50]|uniref:HupE/UreJ family protein n=1 Tax=Chamaesiphon sp. GL140_3_metabinner_50 TaxID=2970812 RepID=UPI0025EA6174|nr:HupE/UreJ family protein [Chamaesiphon sp. GL140_3_metabinner_50]
MKKNQFWQYLAGAISISLWIPKIASAHTGVGDVTGFWHGLEHPIGGLDHILAMLAVGLWAAQMGGKALWLVPGAFITAMIGSSVMGHFGLPLPGVEQGIVASDFILGMLLLFAVRLPLALSAGIVGILAIFHGYAHGAEMPETASGLAYGFGFIISTTLLHVAGIGIGLGIDRYQPKLQQLLFRIGGGATVVGAIYVLVAR